MKAIVCITFVFIASLTQAQEKKHGKQNMQDYTPEEIAQLQTKQLTLDLDLTETQQKQVEALHLENAKARKEKQELRRNENNGKTPKKEWTKEEKLQMKNDMLDKQIEMKKKMKEILNEDQYAKWEKMSKEKKEHRKKRMHKKKKASMSQPKNN
ncbi:hypothetical protein [Xanthomarina gelatinilytica]|uniref:hypothetical protein n=1 Tax=Xanthomarina gelatinilytica TaxID=1137281 RepID=UPI003A8A855D